MIRDEADDFSFLWVINFMPNALVTYCLFWLVTIYSYFRFVSKNFWCEPLFLLVFIPQLLFIFFSILELISLYSGNFILIRPIISLTANMKILGFTFIPCLIIWAKIISNSSFLARNSSQLLKLISAGLLGILVLIFAFADQSGLNPKIDYFKTAFNTGKVDRYTEFLKMGRTLGIPPYNKRFNVEIYKIPKFSNFYYEGNNIFKFNQLGIKNHVKVTDSKYKSQYGKEEVFEKLINAIIDNVDPQLGLITPPYINMLRESLPEYNLYFQEKHDGNLSLGSARFASIMLDRMNLLGHTIRNCLPWTAVIKILLLERVISV